MDLTTLRALRTGGAALTVGLGLAGCGSTTSTASLDSPATEHASVLQLKSPLAPYMLSWQELTIVNHARSLLVRDCLATFQITFPTDSLEVAIEEARAQEVSDLGRMYGITDSVAARANGYWPASTSRASRAVPQSQRLVGCLATADSTLGRSPDRSPYGRARELLIKERADLETSPAARQPIREWISCMDAAGFTVTSPTNDRGDIRFEMRAREAREARGDVGPSKRERAMAAADIDCKARTRLVDRLQQVARLRESLIARRYASDLVADRRRLDQQVNKAEAVIRGAVA